MIYKVLVFLLFWPSVLWANFLAEGTSYGGAFKAQETIPFYQWVTGYETCSTEIEGLKDIVDQYEAHFFKQQYEAAEGSFVQIQKRLKSSSCSDTLWNAYLVMLAGLSSGSYSIIDEPNNDRQVDYGNENQVLVLYLVNKGVIKPLTLDKREQLQKSNDSKMWTAELSGSYQITGFYDCLKSRVYLGSDLRPYNLLASLRHEIDHLYRDKFVDLESFANQISVDSDSSMKSYISHDELFASAIGGFLQRRILQKQKLEAGYHQSSHGDFDFFSPTGSLNDIYSDSQRLPFFVNFLWPVDVFGAKGQETGNKIFDLFRYVRQGYFASSSANGGENSFSLTVSFQTYPQNLEWGFLVPLRYSVLSAEPDEVIQTVKASFDVWPQKLEAPSQSCLQMVQEQEAGGLDDYLGTQMASGGKGGNGGIRPCLKLSL